MRKRHQFGRLRQQLAINFQVKQAVLSDGNELQPDAAFSLQYLPGDEVAVMLHFGQNDQITRFESRPRPAVCHQIN